MQVQCPYCKETYDVEKEQLGMSATCSVCNHTFVLSAPEANNFYQKPKRKKKKGPGMMVVLGPYIKLMIFVGLVGGGGYYLYSKGMLGNKPENGDEAAAAQQAATNTLFQEKTVSDGKISAGSVNDAIIKRDKDRGFVFTEDNRTLLKVPANITSYTIPNGVVNIGPEAFSQCYKLKEIVIPEGVQRIGKEAFYQCYNLESITIPNSVTEIGGNAFYGVEKLNMSSEHPVFAFGEFRELINKTTGTLLRLPVEFEGIYFVPSNVTHIGNEAFFGCSKLTGIAIHDNVVSIGNRAFWGCERLTTITIPNSVKKIGLGAFCTAAEIVVSKDHPTIKVDDSGALIDPDTKTLIYMSRKFKGHYSIPDDVIQIGDSAFAYCFELSGVSIPDTVVSIGERAFSNCLKLRSIMMPDSLSMIGAYAFERCNSITTITIPSKVDNIAAGTFSLCKNLKSITMTDGVKRIEDSAFAFCESLERVNSSKNIEHIGARAFYYCTNIKTFALPESVIFIGERAFYECLNLDNLKLENRKVKVGPEAFAGVLSVSIDSYRHENLSVKNKALIDKQTNTLIYFPRTYTGSYTIPDITNLTIGSNAFYKCQVQEINIPSSVKKIEKSAFANCTNLRTVSIPEGIVKIEEKTFENCIMLDSVSIPEGVTRIAEQAFWGCRGLTSVMIPEGVVQIGKEAFAWSGLENIALPESLAEIGEGAFFKCDNLKDIKLPSGIARIGKNAFGGCFALDELEIPISTFEIGDSAFSSMKYVKVSVHHAIFRIDSYGGLFDSKHNTLLHVPRGYKGKYTVAHNVEVIGSHAFYGCNVNSVSLPEGLAKIGAEAFNNCENLKEIEIPESVTSIGTNALGKIEIIKVAANNPVFRVGSCGELIDWKNKTLVRMSPAFAGKYNVPAGIKKIEEGAFRDCKVTEVIISKDVKEIGDYAFKNCRALTKITIPPGVKEIGFGAFENCSALTDIAIPSSITKISPYLFSNCSALMTITIWSGVNVIDYNAFSDCKNLQIVRLPASVKVVMSSAFSGSACEAQVKRDYKHLFF